MTVYAMVAGGVSIRAPFVAGYLPGLLLGLCLMVIGLTLWSSGSSAEPAR
jgi:TRAP-type C4-dicarboxylate transport system permease large subunit